MTPETILRSENERLRAFIRSLQDPDRFGHAVTREVREAAQRELAQVPVMPEPLADRISPKPRYDEVYEDGLNWLNSL